MPTVTISRGGGTEGSSGPVPVAWQSVRAPGAGGTAAQPAQAPNYAQQIQDMIDRANAANEARYQQGLALNAQERGGALGTIQQGYEGMKGLVTDVNPYLERNRRLLQ